MRLIGILFLVMTFSVQAASPFMSVKERLRISLWLEGIETQEIKSKKNAPVKPLPEELERALRKI